MKKILLLCGMLVALSATVASAAGVNLAWQNCLNGAGSQHIRTFACNINTGNHTLVASVKAPAGIDMWTAFEAEYYFGFGGTQPAWWQLRNQSGQLAQCRNGALSANALAVGLSGCEDVYGGQGSGGVGTYQNLAGPPDRARLLLVFAIPAGTEVPLTPETEYFVANVVITNVKTVGTGACAGCAQPACVNLTNVKVVQPAGAPGGDVNVNVPAQSNTAAWQAGGDAACAGLPTPAQRATWGSVKALYR